MEKVSHSWDTQWEDIWKIIKHGYSAVSNLREMQESWNLFWNVLITLNSNQEIPE